MDSRRRHSGTVLAFPNTRCSALIHTMFPIFSNSQTVPYHHTPILNHPLLSSLLLTLRLSFHGLVKLPPVARFLNRCNLWYWQSNRLHHQSLRFPHTLRKIYVYIPCNLYTTTWTNSGKVSTRELYSSVTVHRTVTEGNERKVDSGVPPHVVPMTA